MSDLLQGMKNATKTNGSRDQYDLNETLAIIAMFRQGMKPKQVAELTGRSVHSLRYKFLEGEIVLNGVKTVRSIKRFSNVKEIFAHFKAEWVNDADVSNRIATYTATLTSKAV